LSKSQRGSGVEKKTPDPRKREKTASAKEGPLKIPKEQKKKKNHHPKTKKNFGEKRAKCPDKFQRGVNNCPIPGVMIRKVRGCPPGFVKPRGGEQMHKRVNNWSVKPRGDNGTNTG